MENPPPLPDSQPPYQQRLFADLVRRFIALGDTPERARELAAYVLPAQLAALPPPPVDPPRKD